MQKLRRLSAAIAVLISALVLLTSLRNKNSGTALVKDIERILPGTPKDEVARVLGDAPAQQADEWVYYLDKHSGYVVKFDVADRVESVLAWAS